jgi:hypothetical protein
MIEILVAAASVENAVGSKTIEKPFSTRFGIP